MREIAFGIWQNAPVWVWPLFFFLLFIGLKAMRTRNSSIIPYFFYPLLGLAAANANSGLAQVSTGWLVFAFSYLLGAAVAFRWQDGLILEKSGWNMTLQGDRITIVILMLIFFSNFINGVLGAIAPHFIEATTYTVIFSAVIGACSGSFTGRTLRVITLGKRLTTTA
ncbi:DUF6622 family protein [Sneathiella sp.]|uniref:DUF6622 family protein n=1 Tax=Sneathiella sp. TaxID=1964365 RepID=UPI00261FCE1D|nr:DUF6622 family protein [Sneathiella sp.]MDF2366771.1 hypothetical protein [Sneathiella sp.]